MEKLTKRKGFKFYRSYYDMFNELDKDKDKLAFITAVLDKQFLGIDPDLKGITKFAYISQIHSIEKQVKGWQDATGEELTGAYTDPNRDPLEGSPREEQEKEEEEEKEQCKIPDYTEFKLHADSKKLNYNTIKLKLKYDSWVENGWKNGNDKPIKNWRSTLTNTLPFILNEGTSNNGTKMTRTW